MKAYLFASENNDQFVSLTKPIRDKSQALGWIVDSDCLFMIGPCVSSGMSLSFGILSKELHKEFKKLPKLKYSDDPIEIEIISKVHYYG
jgi:hypothetical protein